MIERKKIRTIIIAIFQLNLRREKKKNEDFGGNYAKMKVRVFPTNAICTENRVTNKWLALHCGKIFSGVKFRKKIWRRNKNLAVCESIKREELNKEIELCVEWNEVSHESLFHFLISFHFIHSFTTLKPVIE